MTTSAPVTPVALKSAIIAKAWVNPKATAIIPANYTLPTEMTFEANQRYLLGELSLVTDRNLSSPVTIKAGEKLFFYANTKRAGKQDPDYSVSVVLPEDEAQAIIDMTRAGTEAWKKENPQTVF